MSIIAESITESAERSGRIGEEEMKEQPPPRFIVNRLQRHASPNDPNDPSVAKAETTITFAPEKTLEEGGRCIRTLYLERRGVLIIVTIDASNAVTFQRMYGAFDPEEKYMPVHELPPEQWPSSPAYGEAFALKMSISELSPTTPITSTQLFDLDCELRRVSCVVPFSFIQYMTYSFDEYMREVNWEIRDFIKSELTRRKVLIGE